MTFYKPSSAHLRLKNEKPVSVDYEISSGKSILLISCILKLKENTWWLSEIPVKIHVAPKFLLNIQEPQSDISYIKLHLQRCHDPEK